MLHVLFVVLLVLELFGHDNCYKFFRQKLEFFDQLLILIDLTLNIFIVAHLPQVVFTHHELLLANVFTGVFLD